MTLKKSSLEYSKISRIGGLINDIRDYHSELSQYCTLVMYVSTKELI